MKKTLFAFLAVFLLMSCGNTYDRYKTITVINDSTYPVTFRWNSLSEPIPLTPGASATGKVRTHIFSLHSLQPRERVQQNWDSNTVTLTDRSNYEVRILNFTGKDGLLSAGTYMDAIAFLGFYHVNTDCQVANCDNPAHNGWQTDKDNWRVYTSNPKFMATVEGLTFSVQHERDGNTFNVLIR